MLEMISIKNSLELILNCFNLDLLIYEKVLIHVVSKNAKRVSREAMCEKLDAESNTFSLSTFVL